MPVHASRAVRSQPAGCGCCGGGSSANGSWQGGVVQGASRLCSTPHHASRLCSSYDAVRCSSQAVSCTWHASAQPIPAPAVPADTHAAGSGSGSSGSPSCSSSSSRSNTLGASHANVCGSISCQLRPGGCRASGALVCRVLKQEHHSCVSPDSRVRSEPSGCIQLWLSHHTLLADPSSFCSGQLSQQAGLRQLWPAACTSPVTSSPGSPAGVWLALTSALHCVQPQQKELLAGRHECGQLQRQAASCSCRFPP
mmetsp:Transcript_28012/g.71405  ORF Transcript_28012/g.71405 Transcript_28012/m.71405 type:complete len:253 (-) Transcript_28012:912-1670(-)